MHFNKELIDMKIYEKIKYLREERGLSQQELAEMTGYSDRSSIAKVEAGKVDLTRSKIAAFARVFNVQPVTLLDDEDDTFVSQEDEALRTSLQKLKDRPELRTLLDAADGISAEDVEDFAKWLMKMRGVD